MKAYRIAVAYDGTEGEIKACKVQNGSNKITHDDVVTKQALEVVALYMKDKGLTKIETENGTLVNLQKATVIEYDGNDGNVGIEVDSTYLYTGKGKMTIIIIGGEPLEEN